LVKAEENNHFEGLAFIWNNIEELSKSRITVNNKEIELKVLD
jgi:hypothetical protein